MLNAFIVTQKYLGLPSSIVKQGVCWRVGDGSIINVWRDAWLVNEDNPRIQSAVVDGIEDLRSLT